MWLAPNVFIPFGDRARSGSLSLSVASRGRLDSLGVVDVAALLSLVLSLSLSLSLSPPARPRLS